MKVHHMFRGFILLVLFGVMACQKPQTENQAAEADAEISSDNPKIVYIHIDSLLSNYNLYKDNKAEIEAQYQNSEKALSGKIEAFQKRVASFQKEIMEIEQKANTIAPVELQKLQDKFSRQQQNLAKEEESLMKQRDNAAQELEQKLLTMQGDLQNKIDDFLDKIAEEKGYDFVLMKGSGGGVMYGRQTLDITNETLEILNKEYEESKQ